MKRKKKFENIKPVFIAVFFTLIIMNFINSGWLGDFSPQVGHFRELYKKARILQNNREFKEAYQSYKHISEGYIAYDAVLFQEAKCAIELGDEKTAIDKLKTLINDYHTSLLAPQASYSLAQAYIRIGNARKAQNQFEGIIKNYSKTNYAIASYYYLGQINKVKNPAIAVKYWNKYLALSPDGRFSLDCINEIKSSREKLNFQSRLNLAISLYYAHRYNEAKNLFSQIRIENSWYYNAKIKQLLGDRKNALEFFRFGLKNYSNNTDKSLLQDAMLSYVKLNPYPAKESWSNLISFNTKINDFAFYNMAQNEHGSTALIFYKKITDYYPNSYYAPESLWKLCWHEFNNKNYQEAIRIGLNHIQKFKNANSSPKIYFWIAKSFERLGEKAKATKYYSELMRIYPDSYYAFRANGRLSEIKERYDTGWKTYRSLNIDESIYKAQIPYSSSEIQAKYGKLIAELMKVEDYQTIQTLVKKDDFLESWINLKNGFKSKSMVCARNGMNKMISKPPIEDARWQLIYPLYFAENINNSAQINNLDPFIITAIIKEESYFNPFAKSLSDARGLMQLLPGTARDTARWNNFKPINSFMLFNPAVNIQFGAAYFNHIKLSLNNSTLFAVLAYNGGPISVKRWLNTIPHDDMDQFIENIPYSQTRTYIKKVFATYWNYKRIYSK